MTSELLTGTPPPPRKQKMDVIRIVTTEPQQLVVISKTAFGQPVHWWGKRSHECKGAMRACKGCGDNWPWKWQGYLHVSNGSLNWQGFLEFTATAWALIEAQVKPGENLRGAMIRVGRTKGGPKGRYLIEVLERRIPEENLPEEKDPLNTLRLLWGAKKGILPE